MLALTTNTLTSIPIATSRPRCRFGSMPQTYEPPQDACLFACLNQLSYEVRRSNANGPRRRASRLDGGRGYDGGSQQPAANRLLKNSTACVIAWMRSQNSDGSRYFASRAELSSALGEVEKCHDGIFQQAARFIRPSSCLLTWRLTGKAGLRVESDRRRISRFFGPALI